MRNIAHRGASGYAPENTTAAFDLAIDMHADAIETDVQLTSDGHLVLFHDTRLDRTSNGIGPVGERTLAELRELDLGSWFDTSFAGLRIQTLGEALDVYLERIPFVLEIKAPTAAVPMMESISVTDRIEITSFDWDALIRAKERESRFRFGFLTPQFDRETIERCVGAGLGQICPHADTVTADLVAEAQARGLEVRVWGISRRDQIDALLTAGADGTTCNWPDWVNHTP